MLGVYDNFPKTIHQRTCFATAVPWKRLQQTLIKMLHEINSETVNPQAIADPAVRRYTVIFEFGIAEANDFNYLDEEETKKVLKNIWKNPLRTMDFYCAIRYYRTRKENTPKIRPLPDTLHIQQEFARNPSLSRKRTKIHVTPRYHRSNPE